MLARDGDDATDDTEAAGDGGLVVDGLPPSS